jgi:hypothetical protein
VTKVLEILILLYTTSKQGVCDEGKETHLAKGGGRGVKKSKSSAKGLKSQGDSGWIEDIS